MASYGTTLYVACLLLALLLCGLTWQGYRLAGYVLALWAGIVLLALPWLSIIPTKTLLITYSIICFFLLAIAMLLPRALSAKTQLKDLRRLLHATNRMLDAERRKLAELIHDEINPQLILAKLEIEQLGHWLAQSKLSLEDKNELLQFTDSTKRLIREGYDIGRRIINESRIEVLDSVGLVNAVKGLAEHYASVLENIRFDLELPGPDVSLPLGKEQSVNLFGIIREAVLNAVKHAKPTQIKIAIESYPDQVIIDVADNGVGILHDNPNGLGLVDLHERAAAIGATCTITSKAQQGTRVHCITPIAPANPPAEEPASCRLFGHNTQTTDSATEQRLP